MKVSKKQLAKWAKQRDDVMQGRIANAKEFPKSK